MTRGTGELTLDEICNGSWWWYPDSIAGDQILCISTPLGDFNTLDDTTLPEGWYWDHGLFHTPYGFVRPYENQLYKFIDQPDWYWREDGLLQTPSGFVDPSAQWAREMGFEWKYNVDYLLTPEGYMPAPPSRTEFASRVSDYPTWDTKELRRLYYDLYVYNNLASLKQQYPDEDAMYAAIEQEYGSWYYANYFNQDTDYMSLETIQTLLDICGCVPFVGEFADALNVLIYASQGDIVNALLNAGSLIPLVGDFLFKGVKLTFKLAPALDNIVNQITRAVRSTVDDLIQLINSGLIKRINKYTDYIEFVTPEGLVIKESISNIPASKLYNLDELSQGLWSYLNKNGDEIADMYSGKVSTKTIVPSGKYTLDTTPSEILRNELKDAGVTPPPYSNQAHHIVPHGSNNTYAVRARQILEEYGVDVNSASNGIFLPGAEGYAYAGNAAVHNGSHTEAYYKYVYDQLINADVQNADDVISVLNDIRKKLLKGIISPNM